MADEEEWEVQEILQRGKHNNMTHYLVKWKGYPKQEATWEPITHLDHCQQEVMRFEQSLKATTNPQPRTRRSKNNPQNSRKKGCKWTKKDFNLQKVFPDTQTDQPIVVKDEKKTPEEQQGEGTNETGGQKEANSEDHKETKEHHEPEKHKEPEQPKETEQHHEPEKPKEPRVGGGLQTRVNALEALEIVSPCFESSHFCNKKDQTDQTEKMPSPKQLISIQPLKTKMENATAVLARIYDEEPQGLPVKKVKVEHSLVKIEHIPTHTQEERRTSSNQPLSQFQSGQSRNNQNQPSPNLLFHPSSSNNQEREQLQSEESCSASTKTNHLQSAPVQKQTVQTNNNPSIDPQETNSPKRPLSSILHQKSVICDNLLRELHRKALKQLIQDPKNCSTPIFDLTWFPELLNEIEPLQVLEESTAMHQVEALVRLSHGWAVVGKSAGVPSVASVEGLPEGVWNQLLQRYK